MTEVALLPTEENIQLILTMQALEELGVATATSLDLAAVGRELTFDEYEAVGAFLGRVQRSSSWWVGDFLNYGEGLYGEKFAQAVHSTGLAEQTLLNYSYVCRHVSADRRLEAVPFTVHAEVAKLDEKEQTRWLLRAQKGDWSRAELRARMKAKRTDQKPTLPGMEPSEPEPGVIEEIARAIVRDAQPHPDDASLMCVPREDVARLEAALGGK